MSAKMRGAQEMIAKLQRIGRRFPDQLDRSMEKRAQVILDEAKRRCPMEKDGGDLRESGHITKAQKSGRNTVVDISFGDEKTNAYAIAVHEHPSPASPPSWEGKEIHWTVPGTGPKFLEGPINEAAVVLGDELAEDLHFEKIY